MATLMSLAMPLARLTAATGTILWVIAVILVIAGIMTLVRGGVLAGILLIIVGFAVGPGGWSIWH